MTETQTLTSSGLGMTHFDIAGPLPSGTVLLEASAGTGKTWTIAALVTRYVAEGVATLPEMLVVTFGRAASQELRARVREQLVLAERAISGALTSGRDRSDPPRIGGPDPTESPDALIALLLDVEGHELAVRHRRIRAALTDFDAATIATTHQFCQQVLRSLGVAGTTDVGAALVEDLDDLLVEVVDDLYLRGFIRDGRAPFFTRDEALLIARTAVDDVHARLRPTAAEPDSAPDRRVRFAKAVRDELDIRKRRLQVMHYNDLLTQLADALEAADSPARARMRRRWQVVLVDEFQDTDPIQWQVLERAFAGHARAMVLIGDPKQAIYAFRGGDIVTYLEAARTADDRRTLPTNYRSDADLVGALGVLLGGAELGHPDIGVLPITAHRPGSRLARPGDPDHGAGPDFDHAAGSDGGGDQAAGLDFDHAAGPDGGGDGGGRIPPIRLRQVLREQHLHGDTKMAAVRSHVTTDLARDIAGLLASDTMFEGRRIEARDVAVLAHRGADLVAAQRALHSLGIPAVSAGGASVLQSRAAHDWLALLEAMVAPHRSLLTRAAALTDLLGYDIEAIDAVTAEGSGEGLDDELARRCRDLAAVYARAGVAAVLEVLTAQGLSARVLGQVGGERSLTDLRHVAQLLHETARRDDLGLVAVLAWLRGAMAEDAPQSTGARTRRLDSDAAAVQLVTIHGSKGLQYPVVYLPTLADRWVSDTPRIPLFHEPPPERTRCIDVGGPADNPTWDASVTAAKAEDAGESLRLLYVAMTRAQSQVVTWWAPSTNARHSPLHRMLFGRTPGSGPVPDATPVPDDDAAATDILSRWAGLGGLALERADLAAEPAPPPPPTPPDLACATWTRTIDADWRRTSYTALSTPAEAVRAGAVGEVASEPESVPRSDEPDLPAPVLPDAPELPGLIEAAPGAAVASPMADLPVGATFGSLVHAVLEHADPRSGDLRAELVGHIREQLIRWPVDGLDVEVLADALVAVCDTPLGPLAADATLRDIAMTDRLCELDFEMPLAGGDRPRKERPDHGPRLGDLAPLLDAYLPSGDPVRRWGGVLRATPDLADQPLRGYLTGSVDVVLRAGGRYLVVDYKTNWLGRADEPLTAAHYRPEMLAEAMGHSSYPLQALLYAVVAHRFLRWRLRGYSPRTHLGGVLYLYVRGMCGPDTPIVDGHPCGVFSWRPPVRLVEMVSDLLDGRAS
ncbi:MAG: UvrD-helicase domain-containing protein [Dermatophilaceae bacterium]